MPLLTVDPSAQTISATVDVLFTVDPRAQPIFRDVVPPPPPPVVLRGAGGRGVATRPKCPRGFVWSDRWHCCISLEQYEWERIHPPSEEEFYEKFTDMCRELSENEAEQLAVAMGLGLDERPYALTAALIGLALRRSKN